MVDRFAQGAGGASLRVLRGASLRVLGGASLRVQGALRSGCWGRFAQGAGRRETRSSFSIGNGTTSLSATAAPAGYARSRICDWSWPKCRRHRYHEKPLNAKAMLDQLTAWGSAMRTLRPAGSAATLARPSTAVVPLDLLTQGLAAARRVSLRSVSGNNSVVECDLAKVEVAGSNPVSRSIS